MDVYALDLNNTTTNPLARISTIGHLLNIFIPTLIGGAAVLLLIMLLYGSYTLITAGESSDSVAKAKKIMTYSILGLVVVVLSFLLVKLITGVFNIAAPI